jgi:hypothetical protein
MVQARELVEELQREGIIGASVSPVELAKSWKDLFQTSRPRAEILRIVKTRLGTRGNEDLSPGRNPVDWTPDELIDEAPAPQVDAKSEMLSHGNYY